MVSRKNVAQIQTGGQVRSEGRECLGDAKTSDFGLCVGIVRCSEVNEWWRSPLGAGDAGAAAVVDGWAGLPGVAGGCTLLREDSIGIGGRRTGRDDAEGLESWADADAETTS